MSSSNMDERDVIGQKVIVQLEGSSKEAQILKVTEDSYYVHYLGMDKRMDNFAKKYACAFVETEPRTNQGLDASQSSASTSTLPTRNGITHDQSSRSSSGRREDNLSLEESQSKDAAMTEEEYDLKQHAKLNVQKNFGTVIFDTWSIVPWYFSPYPLLESEAEESYPASATATSDGLKIPGVSRATPRAHGRTSDLLAGGLQRKHSGDSTLWVCHFCFKYMVDGHSWERHKKDCKTKRPPGRKVYQRGAHIIWEVDGAKEKLYCQNLSLFGKLFIDVKTLFFDCDNFLFYILTDAKSSEDHILGFFSKEKISYDDYNLACIMTLPQYQKMGYGMLLIEFSYELSRRAGKVGTPERPLSDLGLRGYLSFWVATLIRFFRRVLSVLPPDVYNVQNENAFPKIEFDRVTGDVDRLSFKKSKKIKGFEGESADGRVNAEANLCMMPLRNIPDPIFTTQRVFETKPDKNGGATTHVKVACTLADIARATNLRVEDAAFALNECGFLMRMLASAGDQDSMDVTDDGTQNGQQFQELDDMHVVITRSLVEKVAKERNIRKSILDLACVLP